MHTPAPWTIGVDSYDPKTIMIHDNGSPIAFIKRSANQADNANLIASAPDLLAELDAARKAIADALDNTPYLFPPQGKADLLSPEQSAWRAKLQLASKAARAAVAKAKSHA